MRRVGVPHAMGLVRQGGESNPLWQICHELEMQQIQPRAELTAETSSSPSAGNMIDRHEIE
jgi:hypothetical protein